MKHNAIIAVVTLLVVAFSSFAFHVADKAKTLKVDTKTSSVKWLGKKVTGEHYGKIKIKNGEVVVENNKLKGGTFTIDMKSVTCDDIEDKTWNEKFVGHLKNDDFFSVDKFPTATLKIKDAKNTSGDQYEITGDITIKNITQPISFPATVKVTGNKVDGEAKITVNRTKFDIKYSSGSFFEGLGDKMIYDDFELTVKLIAGK